MTDAFIYDAVRTPRGKGRKDGSLHEVTSVRLAVTALQAIRDRNKLDTHLVDDVVLGCVMPIGEQGADIARTAAVVAGYAESVPGVQVNRFCASGLEATNMAAAQVMSGQSQATIGGGVESMSRVPMGSDGGAWPTDPAVAIPMYFVPQGISADLIATKYGLQPRRRRCICRRIAEARQGGVGRRLLQEVDRAGQGPERHRTPEPRRADAPHHHHADPGGAGTQLQDAGRDDAGLRRRGHAALPRDREGEPRPPCRQFVGHRRRRGRHPDRQQGVRREGRPEAARAASAPSPRSARSRRSC